MGGRTRIVSRFLVALFCFWLVGTRIEDKCGGASGCFGRLDWQDWMLIVVGAGLLSVSLVSLSRQGRAGPGEGQSEDHP